MTELLDFLLWLHKEAKAGHRSMQTLCVTTEVAVKFWEETSTTVKEE